MEGNDIASGWAPRVLWVWEDLLGLLPAGKTREKFYLTTHQWKRAVHVRQLNAFAVNQMWDMVWRKSLRMEVVTFQPEGYAEALQAYLEQANLPISWVRQADEATWASDLAYNVDVVAVLDPDPDRVLRCGSRALHVRPDQLVQL